MAHTFRRSRKNTHFLTYTSAYPEWRFFRKIACSYLCLRSQKWFWLCCKWSLKVLFETFRFRFRFGPPSYVIKSFAFLRLIFKVCFQQSASSIFVQPSFVHRLEPLSCSGVFQVFFGVVLPFLSQATILFSWKVSGSISDPPPPPPGRQEWCSSRLRGQLILCKFSFPWKPALLYMYGSTANNPQPFHREGLLCALPVESREWTREKDVKAIFSVANLLMS